MTAVCDCHAQRTFLWNVLRIFRIIFFFSFLLLLLFFFHILSPLPFILHLFILILPVLSLFFYLLIASLILYFRLLWWLVTIQSQRRPLLRVWASSPRATRQWKTSLHASTSPSARSTPGKTEHAFTDHGTGAFIIIQKSSRAFYFIRVV